MVRFTLLVCVLLTLTGCHERGEEHVRKGHVLFSNRDFAGAEAQYRRAIDDSGENFVALEGLGNVAYEKGDLSAAEAWYRKACAAGPKAVNPRHRLAITLGTKGDVSGAIAVLQEALAIDAKNAFALSSLGGLYQKSGDLKRAEEMQVAALRIDPKHRSARFALANLQLDTGRLDEGERELTRLEADGAKQLAEYGFARLSAFRGEWDDAARHLDAVLAQDPSHPSKVLTDNAFASGWSHPEMQRVRLLLERAAARREVETSSTSTAARP